MSHGLVGNSIQEPCVGYKGMCVCVCVCVKKRHILSYFKTYTPPDCIQVLSHTPVIFTSLCYLWAWSWQWHTPQHLPLHTNISTPGGLRRAVNYNRDIPAGDSFSKEARVGYMCVMGLLSESEHNITHLTLSFSHWVAGHPVFMNGFGSKHLGVTWLPALSAANTLPASCSISAACVSSMLLFFQ